MIQSITIDKKICWISKNVEDFFKTDSIKYQKCTGALEIMNDCLDHIYKLMKPLYPRVFKPELYLADKNEDNALAFGDEKIIIYSKLVFSIANLIEKKYTPECIKKYNIFSGISYKKIVNGLWTYTWRYIVLHELYHIWHNHTSWKLIHEFDSFGNLVVKKKYSPEVDAENTYESEKVLSLADLEEKDCQKYLTQQAIELDADSSAVNTMIDLLMYDIDAKRISQQDRELYIRSEMGFIMGALSNAFCLFDGNAGAKFEALNSLVYRTHPIPSIRFFYAEEIAEVRLNHYFKDYNEIHSLEEEWKKVVCDVEADYKGNVDMGQVFFFTAYTEIAQKHLCMLKHRMTDMHDTLKKLSISIFPEKLEEEDIEFSVSSVWFTKEGKSIKNWVNPTTGMNYAIRADRVQIVSPNDKRQPYVRKHKKAGANDPCPCGSNKKFKKCCRGNGKYD